MIGQVQQYPGRGGAATQVRIGLPLLPSASPCGEHVLLQVVVAEIFCSGTDRLSVYAAYLRLSATGVEIPLVDTQRLKDGFSGLLAARRRIRKCLLVPSVGDI